MAISLLQSINQIKYQEPIFANMAAVRLATVQAVFLSVILVSALLVCKVCVIQYTRSELLNLRSTPRSDLGPSTSLLEEKLRDLNISSHSTPWLLAKKGRRSFAKFRRRPYRPPLPALLLSNVRSLRHKMDELQLMIQPTKTTVTALPSA